MDIDETTDRNHPNHPISIHDMDIDAAVPRAAVWWRSERSDWPLERALLVWLIYEADPPTIYSADNPADVDAFDKLYEKTSTFAKKLTQARCTMHEMVNRYVVGLYGVLVHFRCPTYPPHNFMLSVTHIQTSKVLD